MILRRLQPGDAAAYRGLMLEAYDRHPDAFTSTVAERSALPLQWWEKRLSAETAAREVVWGTFAGSQLTGVAGLAVGSRERVSHKGTLFGMYVRPEFRRRGLGDQLVRTVLRNARHQFGLRIVQLTVTEGNISARLLYERHGFVQFGLEPLAVQVGSSFVTKVHMWCDLLRPTTAEAETAAAES